MTIPLVFTRAALRELDHRAVEEFHLPIMVLMENAGRAVAEVALRDMAKKCAVLVLAGPGNNGGDGLVAARHLRNAGVRVVVLLLSPRGSYKDAAGAQLAVLDAMHLPVQELSADHAEFRDWLVESRADDLIIDALFGTGLSRAVEGLAADLITAVNNSGHPVLAVDIPSGLDGDTGEPVTPESPVIEAAETVSFCGTKAGFTRAKKYTGKVTIADIGVPRVLLESLAVTPLKV